MADPVEGTDMTEGTAGCADCGATGRKLVRTVCMKCYHHRRAAGRLDDLPKKTTADRFRHLADRTEKRCGTCFVTKPLEARDRLLVLYGENVG